VSGRTEKLRAQLSEALEQIPAARVWNIPLMLADPLQRAVVACLLGGDGRSSTSGGSEQDPPSESNLTRESRGAVG
jgi:hypothetical protein